MQLPTVSGSIEVWDFLSVDSQVQYFSLLTDFDYRGGGYDVRKFGRWL